MQEIYPKQAKLFSFILPEKKKSQCHVQWGLILNEADRNCSSWMSGVPRFVIPALEFPIHVALRYYPTGKFRNLPRAVHTQNGDSPHPTPLQFAALFKYFSFSVILIIFLQTPSGTFEVSRNCVGQREDSREHILTLSCHSTTTHLWTTVPFQQVYGWKNTQHIKMAPFTSIYFGER